METDRLEAFSDGVFAVAITFLVFTLGVPDVGSGKLWSALLKEWPSFASYTVSFLIIGIMWVNHHGLFHRIARVDRPLLFLNLLLLMTVVAIPFSAALLAKYITSGANSHVAAAVFSVTMTFMSVGFSAIWTYAVFHHELLEDRLDPQLVRSSLPRFTGGVLIYVLTIGVAFINAILCLVIHALIALYYVFDQIASATPVREGSDQQRVGAVDE